MLIPRHVNSSPRVYDHCSLGLGREAGSPTAVTKEKNRRPALGRYIMKNIIFLVPATAVTSAWIGTIFGTESRL